MLAQEMQNTLIEFTKTIDSWIIGEEKELKDLFESEYSENYAPGNAAMIFASVYNYTRDKYHLNRCYDMIRRSIKLLEKRESVSPFCRVFLLHYSLMAILYLPEEEKKSAKKEFGRFYGSYEDDCNQINTNCAALQWGNEVFLSMLGYKKLNKDKIKYLLTFISNGQNHLGFINDSIPSNGIPTDGMPIAYHTFILSILTGVIVATSDSTEYREEYNLTKEIIKKGYVWSSNTLASDATFAMAERSSHQMFTWGALVSTVCFSGSEDSATIKNVYENWLKYKKTDGSYSCTPNYLPHELRTGFETYTHVNMYNTLGFVGIATAEKIISKDLRVSSAPSLSVINKDYHFIDIESGYAFYKKGKNFYGCSLRLHEKKYIPSMQGFHFRLNGKETPLAEPKLLENTDPFNRYLMNSLFEGYILKDTLGKQYFSDSVDNARINQLDYGFELIYEDDLLTCQKRIQVYENKIEWDYTMTPKVDFVDCEHVLPIVVFDGKEGIKSRVLSNKTMNLFWRESQYQISCNKSRKITLSVDQPRNLMSVSGVSTLLKIRINSNIFANQTIQWKTTLRFCNNISNEATYEEKLNAENLELNIVRLEVDKQGPQQIGTSITYTVEATGKQLSYAWYVYKNSERIHVEWYTDLNYFKWAPNEPGVYRILVFVKDFEDNKVTRYSEETTII
ncbi:hypothetical protein KHA93_13400 [Bacillus sp. FJAT-49732]|uniref:Two component regulator three Y domain-containing protein n=1 Tax=Lederbergia citrisecunda TaxID=2833583 RepID=A0A942YKP7_9BACI|nr:hypothetical protein [Lederbergia citrisecunda]MBS4200628.1 hypothetical protein [Lederbergia citrisecunda]